MSGLISVGQAETERYWRQPHDQRWMEGYIASITHAVRTPMANALKVVAPFSTALDLGCHCGVLMPMLLDASPNVMVTGIDVNAQALQLARRVYPSHLFIEASIVDWLPLMAKYRHYDVLTSSACLAHISPEKIDAVLSGLSRVATRAIVIQETTTTPQLPEARSTAVGVHEWRYDYPARMAQHGWALHARAWQTTSTTRPTATMLFRHRRRPDDC